jgi:hypothetical protein
MSVGAGSSGEEDTVPNHEGVSASGARGLGWGMWYAAGLLVSLEYVERLMLPAWKVVTVARDLGAWLSFAKTAIGLLLIGGAFAALHLYVRAAPGTESHREPAGGAPSAGVAFPDRVTLAVGGVVLALAMVSVIGLLRELDASPSGPLHGPLIAVLSAGVGSSVATVMGFLKHASEEKNFDRAYSAWYIGRPVTGALLGLLFYFLLRGGLLALVPNGSGSGALNDFALAGACGLVGLFSKNALEKLREVFNVAFKVGK